MAKIFVSSVLPAPLDREIDQHGQRGHALFDGLHEGAHLRQRASYEQVGKRDSHVEKPALTRVSTVATRVKPWYTLPVRNRRVTGLSQCPARLAAENDERSYSGR